MIPLRLGEDLDARVRELAAADNRPVANYVADVVIRWVRKVNRDSAMDREHETDMAS